MIILLISYYSPCYTGSMSVSITSPKTILSVNNGRFGYFFLNLRHINILTVKYSNDIWIVK